MVQKRTALDAYGFICARTTTCAFLSLRHLALLRQRASPHAVCLVCWRAAPKTVPRAGFLGFPYAPAQLRISFAGAARIVRRRCTAISARPGTLYRFRWFLRLCCTRAFLAVSFISLTALYAWYRVALLPWRGAWLKTARKRNMRKSAAVARTGLRLTFGSAHARLHRTNAAARTLRGAGRLRSFQQPPPRAAVPAPLAGHHQNA